MYKTKSGVLAGTDFREVRKRALRVYAAIHGHTRRRAYVRSAYFKKEKIFLSLFWHHLFDKEKWRDRMRRIRYFEAAIEIIQRSHLPPESKENPNRISEVLHRFAGMTREGHIFCIQIKEDKRSGRKDLISIFPKT